MKKKKREKRKLNLILLVHMLLTGKGRRKSEKVTFYFICYLINVSKICQKNKEIIIIISSNERLGSAFHRICSVIMENWVV